MSDIESGGHTARPSLSDNELFALVGPTASGKESVALALGARYDAEILSLDSMKVYRGMDIGTAKAGAEKRRLAPHHLLDLVEPTERFSTKRWLEAASAAVLDTCSRGRAPLFSGGTALYLKALLYGLFDGPDAHPELRARLAAEPPEELHRRLEAVDPATAAKVHVNDIRRVIRALEVFELTGRPASELREQWAASEPRRRIRIAGIARSRQDLYRRIDLRIDRMLADGLVQEVRGLLETGLGPVASQALGYKEIADFLEGRLPSLDEAVVVLKRRTRAFARRQTTWFKHFPIEWVPVAPDDPVERVAEEVAPLFGWR